jgi:glycosyltransferase involved in cell wall biosynthesis
VPHAAFIVPGDLDTRTGGYIYDKRIVSGLRHRGWHVDVRQPAELSIVPDGMVTVVDGLALLSCAGTIEHAAARLRFVPLVHLPLALEVGLEEGEAARRQGIEDRALRLARLIVATGRVTVADLIDRGVAPPQIALVEPGTARAPLARGSQDETIALTCVAAVTAGKGHEQLLRALAAVPSRAWTLTCAGSLDRDPETSARMRALVSELALGDRVTFVGELDDDDLAELQDRSDAFVFASRRETYGMAVAEAIARGLPVVSTAVGAIADIVGGGGIVVDAGDTVALASALTRVITDDGERRRLRDGACAARERLRDWENATCAMATALTRVTA